jgi:hypothetical protein
LWYIFKLVFCKYNKLFPVRLHLFLNNAIIWKQCELPKYLNFILINENQGKCIPQVEEVNFSVPF